MNDIIIVGAGGLGRETAWVIEKSNLKKPEWNILGFIDDNEAIQNTVINGYKVLGGIEDVRNYKNAEFICALGNAKVKKTVVERMKSINPDIKFATVIDADMYLSDTTKIGKGSIISTNTTVNVNITIGEHVLVHFGSTVGHDAVIGDYTTVYPGANISGSTKIGSCCELGTGMQIIQGKKVCDNCIIGAGAVVVKDLTEEGTYVGLPAKKIK